ncbi:MAG TPA: LPS export ABC transporter ATP-binding protein [Fimbriimonadaceae bacterium]|nr:LPS export ABC transporter ATP-binding protein [Fimbriimonadaceae bacterium]
MTITGSGLVKRYRGRPVVNDVTFTITQGEIVGLLGPNGAGKTTTFYMVVGLVKPNAGEVKLDDVALTKMPMYQRARAGIGYLPQEPSVFRKLSVRDNLRLVLQLKGLSAAEIDKQIDYLANQLHVTHILDSQGSVLSGGERRRVEIARALATEPKFILLDEPFAGIDPKTIEEIQDIIFRLKKQGIGILITDHNVAATLRITDRNYILADGQIIAEGDRKAIVGNEQARKFYLGEQFEVNFENFVDKPEDDEPKA